MSASLRMFGSLWNAVAAHEHDHMNMKCDSVWHVTLRIALRKTSIRLTFQSLTSLPGCPTSRTPSFIRPVERGEGRGKFSRAPRHLGAPPSLKNTEKGVTNGFFLTSNMHKIHFWRPGSGPDLSRRAYDAPRPLVGW